MCSSKKHDSEITTKLECIRILVIRIPAYLQRQGFFSQTDKVIQ